MSQSHTLTIQPSGQQITVQADESIIDAAIRTGIALPYGCRNGACGNCRGKLLSGDIDRGQHSPNLLSDADKEAGMAIFCQAKLTSDVSIEVDLPEAGAIRPQRFPARVARLERLAHDVMGVYLKLPDSKRLQFKAGQYLDVLLRDGRRRSFSFANAPHDDAHVVLHIRNVPGGDFSAHVFDGMQEKDILRIEAPFGDFTLHTDTDRPMVLMAGGTGFAPIKGVLESAFEQQHTVPMTLYWGARAQRDLYQLELAETWAQQHDHFDFVPVLSEPDTGWQGRTGWVHEAILEDIPDLKGHDVYACGPPVMVKSGHDCFIANGLPREHFFSDPFEYAKD